MDAIDVVLRANDLVAVLTRDVSVRLLNISASGCLLHSDSRLREGTTASLRLTVNGIEYSDDVRVIRCTEREGCGSYHVGAEFLWTTSPDERSLRRALAGLASGALRVGPIETRAWN